MAHRDDSPRPRKGLAQLLALLVIGTLFILTTGCSDRYQEGYQAGYKAGYVRGEEEGYQRGYVKGEKVGHTRGMEEGYSTGYQEGTVYFLEEKGLPSLGLIVLVFLSFLVLFWLYLTWRGRLRERMEQEADTREVQRQKKALKHELVRIGHAYEEGARVLAASIQSTVYAKARMAIGSSKISLSLDCKIREIEPEIFDIHMKEINKTTCAYQEVASQIDRTEYLNGREKGELYLAMKQRVSHLLIQQPEVPHEQTQRTDK